MIELGKPEIEAIATSKVDDGYYIKITYFFDKPLDENEVELFLEQLKIYLEPHASFDDGEIKYVRKNLHQDMDCLIIYTRFQINKLKEMYRNDPASIEMMAADIKKAIELAKEESNKAVLNGNKVITYFESIFNGA